MSLNPFQPGQPTTTTDVFPSDVFYLRRNSAGEFYDLPDLGVKFSDLQNNIAPGQNLFSSSTGPYSIIENNQTGSLAAGNFAFVGGAYGRAYGNYSFQGGGYVNESRSGNSFIGVGGFNYSYGYHTFIGAGFGNRSTASQYSSIIGGYENKTYGRYSFIGNGIRNTAYGAKSSVLNGTENTAYGYYSNVINGRRNYANGYYTSIGNGRYNYASGVYSTVENGYGNSARGRYSTVVNGYYNRTYGNYSTVLAGSYINTSLQNTAIAQNFGVVTGGTNPSAGVATLASGATTINTAQVTTASIILVTPQDANTTGFVSVAARTPGTSFTITSSSPFDNGSIGWIILEPAN